MSATSELPFHMDEIEQWLGGVEENGERRNISRLCGGKIEWSIE